MPDIPATFGRRSPAQRRGGSATLRDHSRAYRRLRGSLLDKEPLCRYCRAEGRIAAATVLDHIVALSLGGANDPANLAPACQECNAEKAKAEQRFLARCLHPRDIMADVELGSWIRRAAAQPGL
ncbi:HNH endonuclease [Novosphingobium sp. 9U]|uniref:HNH endonuclease n=1 Tax=Novosphingobium sp. 9U TaxID=2653158 RepID=UPI0012F39265|nr:conserved hypothetical protein [Novosphingobium sp. 9U]